jgi:O-antigen ligase
MKHNIANITNFNLLNKILLFIIFCFPFILILRSSAINIAIIIASIIVLFFFVKKIKTDFFKNKLSIYLIVFLFFIFVNTLLHNQDLTLILKSLGNYRYLILSAAVYLALNFSSQKSKKNFIYFNIFLVVLVALDIVYQYIFQKDIFGFAPGFCNAFEKNCTRFSGVFGDELIAGGYLSQVGMLVLFLMQKLENEKSRFDKALEVFFVISLLLVILLTGERNAILIFLLSICFFYIFQKKFLNLIFIFFIFFIFALTFSKKINSVNSRFFHAVDTLGNIYLGKKSPTEEKIKDSPWGLHYQTAIELFLERPIIGHGAKSFRIRCKDTDVSKELILKNSRFSACSTHPHNYLLEFLAEQGLIGGALFLGLILGIIVKIFRIRNYHTREAILAIGLGSLMLAIMFPLKPSGSFFSTFNASLLFYIMGFFLYYSRKIK